MKTLALSLIAGGAVLMLVGALLWLAARFNLPLGRLPGDIHLQGRNWSFGFPIVTCLIVSLLLTLLLNLFLRR